MLLLSVGFSRPDPLTGCASLRSSIFSLPCLASGARSAGRAWAWPYAVPMPFLDALLHSADLLLACITVAAVALLLISKRRR